MSEEQPARANEVQRVTDSLYFWQAYDPTVRVDLSCCAVRVAEGWVLIDPIALHYDALGELLEAAQPVSVVLTNGNHARAAKYFADRFSIPIFAHPDAEPELGFKVDGYLREGEQVAGALSVIELAGAGPGEIAVLSTSGLHVGDALINLEPHGLTLLPEKYCSDLKKLRSDLGKLLKLDFPMMTFAHGLPLLNRPKESLVKLLS